MGLGEPPKSKISIDRHARPTLDLPPDLIRKYRIRSAAEFFFFSRVRQGRKGGRLTTGDRHKCTRPLHRLLVCRQRHRFINLFSCACLLPRAGKPVVSVFRCVQTDNASTGPGSRPMLRRQSSAPKSAGSHPPRVSQQTFLRSKICGGEGKVRSARS